MEPSASRRRASNFDWGFSISQLYFDGQYTIESFRNNELHLQTLGRVFGDRKFVGLEGGSFRQACRDEFQFPGPIGQPFDLDANIKLFAGLRIE